MDTDTAQNIVIIGGGAVGCSVAYFLTRHPKFDPEKQRLFLFEATKVAGGASGKAGGCLASWASPACLAPLSFSLHADLAAKYGGEKWGYRRTSVFDCQTTEEESIAASLASSNPEGTPDWILPDRIRSIRKVGGPSDTGQVHPYLYTTFLASKAEASGVQVKIASVMSINYAEDHTAVKSVTYVDKGSDSVTELRADRVVLAAGPWTPNLLPKVPVVGARSHSIVLDVPSHETSPDTLFFNHPNPESWFPKLEVYPRPDDTTFVCGPTDWRVPLPESTDLVDVDTESCLLLQRAAESLSSKLVGEKVRISQACYRPVLRVPGRARSVGPLIGETGVSGLILATGHDEWGIQNSPGTGKIISEIILDGKAISADISTLDPRSVLQ